jgi:hypothetical protein
MIYSTAKISSEKLYFMFVRSIKFLFVLIFINISISGFSQELIKKDLTKNNIIDSLKRNGLIINENQKAAEISLSRDQAIRYLQKKVHHQLWNNSGDPLRQALGQLIFEAEHQTRDSLKKMLIKYPYDSLNIPWNKFYIWEPLRLKIPVISPPDYSLFADTTMAADTISGNDVRDSLNFSIPSINKPSGIIKSVAELKDTTILVIIDTLKEVKSSSPHFPFKYLNYPFQADSIKAAVISLLDYLDERDSSVINITGLGRAVTPIILNSKSQKVMRYWLRNEFSDSVTIWIANPSRNTIGLYPEQGVNFRRPIRQGNYAKAKVDFEEVDKTKLKDLQNIALKTLFWKYHTETAFVLNQAALSNWVKGGENSLSTALDITGYADYSNRPLKVSSNNFARLKFGYLKSGHEALRKNIDLLETNSKLNHKAFGKFDFSAILLFKTQIAKGRNYFSTATGRDTSNVVSKFFNPAIITIGLGLDFKPNKTTSINFSPLSYKGTFVSDPAYYHNTYDSTKIDQTQYGVPKNRKSLNEPGVSFMITNEFKPIPALTIVNRLQLFTNYIHNPQNIDVDWEMIATARLNWFTDVRFNTHLIFDDDTKTDKLVEGVLKKTARIQFKEMLGFSLYFRF